MKVVHSFDIFDTLLARTVENPIDIFDSIEKSIPYTNFKQLRLKSQANSNNTMDSIYHQFKLLSGESDNTIQMLREFELKTEMENTIPIMSNIVKIQDGDIFVSDMYLSHDEIRRLLNYHSINPNTELFVSSGGKADGSMWGRLVKEYAIVSHTGDNYHSDIVMASKYSIKGVYTDVYKFSPLEHHLYSIDAKLCTLLRRFRLMNPYKEMTLEYKLFDQQIQYNIPMLLFMCRKLNSILKDENRTTVLFLSRDGCLIHRLFSFLYPQYKSIYLYSSRILNTSYTDEYISYLKKHYNEHECIMFDLHGSFQSGRPLFMKVFGHLPRIYIFDLSTPSNYYNKMTYTTRISEDIERFNQDINGSVIDYKNGTPIHMPTESPLNYIKILHTVMDFFLHSIKDTNVILSSDILNNEDFWKSYYKEIVITSERILDNIYNHPERMLTYLANKYKSDKGDQYMCSHHYTIPYQEIISMYLSELNKKSTSNQFDLLEIGLNRDSTSSIPSLLIWNDYFYSNINITGFDINKEFLQFNSLYNNIKIFCGDQSNESDLQQLVYKQYNIIIDDGYHGSKHQQISFKTLWPSVKSGGYYIIEDLHYQPEQESCVKTKALFEQWKSGNFIESEYISISEIHSIQKEIHSIGFYDSKSKLWGDSVKNAFVYIKKL